MTTKTIGALIEVVHSSGTMIGAATTVMIDAMTSDVKVVTTSAAAIEGHDRRSARAGTHVLVFPNPDQTFKCENRPR